MRQETPTMRGETAAKRFCIEKGKGGTKIQCKERKDDWRDAEQQQRHAKQGE